MEILLSILILILYIRKNKIDECVEQNANSVLTVGLFVALTSPYRCLVLPKKPGTLNFIIMVNNS